jgi:hypothetical protein
LGWQLNATESASVEQLETGVQILKALIDNQRLAATNPLSCVSSHASPPHLTHKPSAEK